MRPTSLLALAVFSLAGCVLAGIAVAQQMGDGVGGAAGGGADGGAQKEVPKRVERAARIVTALEAAKKRAEAADVLEGAYIAQLDAALEDARAMTKPVTAEELTDAEKDALADELGAPADDGGAAADRRQEWIDRTLASAFEDAGLSEEEESAATPIITDWYGKFFAARGDSKQQGDLKRQRDEDLRKLLGRKKANKVINNLNSAGGWGRGR